MGCYAVGSECCNNCVHWNCHTERRFRGNPPKEVYTESNCDKCLLTDRNTLSENTCGMFRHIGGVKNTFAVGSMRRPGDVASAAIVGMDESMRGSMQSVIDYLRTAHETTVELHSAEVDTVAPEEEVDDLDGDAERAFAANMEEQGRANGRTRELKNEGLDIRYVCCEKAVDFMHHLDKAKTGDARAQYAFAMMFMNGTHGAIKQGSSDEGDAFFRNALHNSYSLAYYWGKKAADQGYARAEYLLGQLDRSGNNEGHGERKWSTGGIDYVRSLEWFSRAAEHGYSGAHKAYADTRREAIGVAIPRLLDGLSFMIGLDKKKDLEKAVDCIRRASDEVAEINGFNGCAFSLSSVDGEAVCEIVDKLERIGSSVEPRAFDVLGLMYGGFKNFRRIVREDASKAKSYFEKGAEKGCVQAMEHLGQILSDDWNRKELYDAEQAALWFRKAAECGAVTGKRQYARCLMTGCGVQKDENAAMDLYLSAAAEGDVVALGILAQYAENGEHMSEDPELAFEWNRLAADMGDADAMHRLASCYGRGYGAEKNETLKKKWDALAAQHGYREPVKW